MQPRKQDWKNPIVSSENKGHFEIYLKPFAETTIKWIVLPIEGDKKSCCWLNFAETENQTWY